jgi:small subunit ribosomal protein S24e
MKFEKMEEIKNALFDRKEANALISFSGPTPKREEIKKEICSKIGANPQLSVLSKVETQYGSTKINVKLHVYENEEKMKKTEPYHLLVRDKIAEKKPKKEKAKKK